MCILLLFLLLANSCFAVIRPLLPLDLDANSNAAHSQHAPAHAHKHALGQAKSRIATLEKANARLTYRVTHLVRNARAAPAANADDAAPAAAAFASKRVAVLFLLFSPVLLLFCAHVNRLLSL